MAVWPSGVASDSDLYQAKNNLSTTLNGAIDNVTTTIVLTDASAFPAVGFVTIGNEAIKYTGVAVNTLTGVTRGADGTTAVSHLNGTAVNHYAVAAHHNAPKDEIIAVETQLAAEMAATKEPTGFPDASTTTISVVDGTRTFTIAPTGASFDVYVQGKKFTKTSENVTFTDTEGLWFFYYNTSGVLVSSQTPWTFTNGAPVSLLYWDATNNVSLDLADERHGSAMDWATHQYLHTTVGTRFGNGLGASGYVINSAVNADVRFAFDAGTIYDEDLKVTIGAQTEPAQIPVFYRDGLAGMWRRAAATDYPYLTTGTGRIAYNRDTAGTWSQAEVTNGDFCAYWIFATNGANYPIISIQGQRQDTSLANAQNNNLYESLAFGTLPYAEMKLLYRVIVQTSNAYGSTMKVRVSEVQDLRSVSNLPAGSYVATDHNSLTGRSTAASHPATAISNTPAGTIAATDVQAAIDELDTEKQAALGFTPENVANKSTDGTLAANSTTLYPSQSAVKTYADTKQASLGFTPVNKAGDTGIGTLQLSGSMGIGVTPTDRFHIKGATNENLTIGGHLGIAAGVSISVQDDGPSANVPLEIRASKTTFTGGGVGGEVAMPGVYANTDASAANVYVDSSGNLKRSTASGGGGSGTVNSGTAAQLAYYAATGTAVSGASEIVTDGDQLVIGSSAVSNSNRLQIYNSLSTYGISVEASAGNANDSARMIFQAWDSADKSNALVIGASNSGTTGSTIYTTTNTSTGDLFLRLVAGGVTGIKLHSTSNQIETEGAGTVSVPQFVLNGDTDTGIYAPAADEWAVARNGALGLHMKASTTSGTSFGIGCTPNASYALDVVQSRAGTTVNARIQNSSSTANSHCDLTLESDNSSTGDATLYIWSGSTVDSRIVVGSGSIWSLGTDGSDSSAFKICNDVTIGTSEYFRIATSTGYLRAIGVYNQTTASAANVYVDSSGNLMRSTSSLRYKTAIKDVALEEATRLLDATPVTYASLCEGDNKEERHYGFIAEELDLIDPTLVNYKTLEDGTKVPDGVQYERVVVGLLKLVQDLTKRVADLEAKQA